MGLSGTYGKPAPEEERLGFLDKAYELGERFWDTGRMHASGRVKLMLNHYSGRVPRLGRSDRKMVCCEPRKEKGYFLVQ